LNRCNSTTRRRKTMKPFSNDEALQRPSTVEFSAEKTWSSRSYRFQSPRSLGLGRKTAENEGLALKKCCAMRFRSKSMKLERKTWSTVDLSIRKVTASESIERRRKRVSNLSLSSETDVTVNLTTFEPVLRVQKLGNGPQDGPEDREEAWGRLGAQTWRK